MDRLGIAPPRSPKFHFEYRVPVRGGRGTPSHTDLMVIGEGSALAIEAKYTEPAYALVWDWLGRGPSENRRAVLAGWVDPINEKTGANLEVGELGDVTYQLVHRTASVRAAPAKDRYVA